MIEQVVRTAVRLRGVEPGAAVCWRCARRPNSASRPRRPDAVPAHCPEARCSAPRRPGHCLPDLGCWCATRSPPAWTRPTRQGILDVLAGWCERLQPSLAFITHDLAAAGRLADRIAVPDGGRVVEQGPARRILTEAGPPFTRMLVGASGAEDGGEGPRGRGALEVAPMEGERHNGTDARARSSARWRDVWVTVTIMSTKTMHFTHYTVQSGDTLTVIANMFGTTIDQLAKWNNISNPDLINIGQKLIVNKSDAPHDTFYTVKSGDTLTAIAHRFGTTIDQLVTWNGIPDPDVIQVAQRLIVAKSVPVQA
nr:LysM peptidoglycan-binding domain-containing protein [Embleya hyalina]